MKKILTLLLAVVAILTACSAAASPLNDMKAKINDGTSSYSYEYSGEYDGDKLYSTIKFDQNEKTFELYEEYSVDSDTSILSYLINEQGEVSNYKYTLNNEDISDDYSYEDVVADSEDYTYDGLRSLVITEVDEALDTVNGILYEGVEETEDDTSFTVTVPTEDPSGEFTHVIQKDGSSLYNSFVGQTDSYEVTITFE